MLIPFANKLAQLGVEVLLRVKVGDAQALALEDAEPLLHLIHPRAVHGRKVEDKARVFCEPLSHFFAVMRTDIVAHEMNGLDVLPNLHIQLLKECYELLLTLAWVTLPKDLARTSVEGGKKVQGSAALVFMLMPSRYVPRLSRLRRMQTTTRLQRGFFVDGQDHLVIMQWTRVEIDECRDSRIKSGVPWVLGIQPEMVAPRLELVAGQNPPHGRHGNVLNKLRCDELTRQFGAIPLGEAAAQRVWTLAGEPHHVDRDFGGKTRPWPRGQGRPPGPRGVGPQSASPTCERRSVGHRLPVPRRIANGQRPARG